VPAPDAIPTADGRRDRRAVVARHAGGHLCASVASFVSNLLVRWTQDGSDRAHGRHWWRASPSRPSSGQAEAVSSGVAVIPVAEASIVPRQAGRHRCGCWPLPTPADGQGRVGGRVRKDGQFRIRPRPQ
jgi:hypothetical protein